MLKADEDLKIFYPHMLHLTCLAYELHRVADQKVDLHFPSVNKLILSVKKSCFESTSSSRTLQEKIREYSIIN